MVSARRRSETVKPYRFDPKSSSAPGLFDATTAVPDAIASRYGSPKPSYRLGKENTHADRYNDARSSSESFPKSVTPAPPTLSSATIQSSVSGWAGRIERSKTLASHAPRLRPPRVPTKRIEGLALLGPARKTFVSTA